MLVNTLRRFRESLRRATDGAEAFLILTLFILCLDKVSTDHAKLVPLGKVCTAKESLEKNTAKATMAALEYCLNTNVVYWKRRMGNVEFHEVMIFFEEGYVSHRAQFNDWSHSSAQPSDGTFLSEQPIDFPRPSPTPTIPDSIPEPSGENLEDHSSNDTSLSGNEDEMTLQNVYDLCISLCQQVTDQAKEIKLLKAKITKLKKQAKPVIKHYKEYLKSISLRKRFPRKSSSKKARVHKKNVSKQGRKKAKGESSVQRDPMFEVLAEDKIDHKETENAQTEGRSRDMMDEDKEIDEERLSTEDEVSTVKEGGGRGVEGTEESNESTEEIFEGTEEQREGTEEQRECTEEKVSTDEQMEDETIATLLLNMSKAKAASKEKRESLFQIDPKDKGKKKIKEEEESESEDDDIPQAVKKFKQLESDEELARKIQEDWEAEEERNKIVEEQATNEALIKNFDDIKARIEADKIFVEKLQEQEREQFTIEERAKILKVEVKEEMRRENTRKESTNDELRLCLTIAPDEDKEVDYEILDKKYPIIDWKTENLGTKPQFDETKRSEEINLNVVTRSNGQKRFFSTLIGVLSVFDREDLNAIYKLVMDIYQDRIPEGFDKVLWGDLIVMFNPDEQDEFWNSQHEWKVISWKLHSSSGVHTLMTDEGLVIHMLIEKKYPLKKEIVVQMLKLKLESEEESTMALELIRFIKKSWLVQDQTVLGKDYSNLLIADSLLKTIWFINAPCYDNEALASPNTNDEELSIPEQTATGKGTSNPLMAGSLPKTTKTT
ncbi:hypothetical protein Tco_1556161 [Tanacetum coccineum]